jgi:hypothetical protein
MARANIFANSFFFVKDLKCACASPEASAGASHPYRDCMLCMSQFQFSFETRLLSCFTIRYHQPPRYEPLKSSRHIVSHSIDGPLAKSAPMAPLSTARSDYLFVFFLCEVEMVTGLYLVACRKSLSPRIGSFR